MKTKNLLVSMYVISLVVITSIYSCNNDNSTSIEDIDKNTISGTITFVDTNFLTDTTQGYYSVDAYATWPPTGNASSSLKLIPAKQSDNTYKAEYKFTSMPSGSYVITSAYIKLPYIVGSSVLGLGTYGCDTSHYTGCIYNPTIQKAIIKNDFGVEDINFKSWADTSKNIYRF